MNVYINNYGDNCMPASVTFFVSFISLIYIN